MDLTNFIAHNISAFGDVELDFSDLTFCYIRGEKNIEGVDNNGACKTGLFDVPTWVLYDNTAKGISKDYMIREGTKSGWAGVGLQDHLDNTYKVERYRGRKGNQVKLWENGTEITEKGMTQKKIEAIMDHDFQAFTSSAYFGQNELNNFCSGSNSKRTEIIEGIVTHIRKIDILQDILKVEYKSLSESIKDLEISKLATERLMEQIDIKRAKKLKSKYILLCDQSAEKSVDITTKFIQVEHKKKLIDEIDEVKVNLNQYKAELAKRMDEYIDDTRRLEESRGNNNIVKLRNKLAKRKKAVARYNRKYDKVKKIFDKVLKSIAHLDADMNIDAGKLKRRKASLGMDAKDKFEPTMQKSKKRVKCDECLMYLDKEGFKRQVSEGMTLESNLKQIKLKHINLREKAGEFRERLEHLADKERDASNDTIVVSKDIEHAKVLSQTVAEDLKRVKKRALKIRDDGERHIKHLKKQIKKAKKLMENYKDVDESKYDHYSRLLNKLNRKTDKYEKKAKEAIKQIRDYKENKDEYDRLQELYESNSKEMGVFEYCNKHFPKMKVFMVGSVLPDINQQLKDNLTALKFDFDVTFKVGRELKRGSIKDELDIEIINLTTGYKRIWKQLSGGEQQRISVATYLALNSLSNFNMIFMDEVLRNMDDTGRKLTLDLLYQKSLEGKKVFVIDHLKDVENLFDQTILVKNIDGVSQIVR